MDELLLWISLRSVPGLGRRAAHQLLEAFGSPREIFARAALSGGRSLPSSVRASLAPGPDLRAAEAEIVRSRRLGLRIVACDAPDFPPWLRAIPDPPLVLWIRGTLPAEWGVAIVGARRASVRGRRVAEDLAAAAASSGVAVISGLAYGIDAAAHAGAVAAGGCTLAVLAGGLERASPTGNGELARRILGAGGAWVSEHPPGTRPTAWRFPERNRLVSGLARAVLVVEAGEKSGSLWTVRHALDQGRDVLTVPGPVDLASCRGSNRLLRDGAVPILAADDLLLALGVEPRPATRKSSGASGAAGKLLAALDAGPREVDALGRELSLTPAELSAALLELELAGLARREGSRVLRGAR